MVTASMSLTSCDSRVEDSLWMAPDHPADRLQPWCAAGDSLSLIALQWVQALDRGDTLGLRAFMADSLNSGEPGPPDRSAFLRFWFYRYRSGYRQETECLALLPTMSMEDSVCRVMGYLRQRFRDVQVGSSLPWKHRRIAVLWELQAGKIVRWTVWEQDWPGTHQAGDSMQARPWPRWGMRCSNAPDSLRHQLLAWEKRLTAHYVRDAGLFWNDTSSARSDDGWVWTGPPLTMARFMAAQAAPYRDQDSVRRALHHVQTLRLGHQGEFLGLAFGNEKCYRNHTVSDRRIHRLYFFRNGKIAFADQYRNSSLMP
jgi:hypothetical protein